MTHDFLLIFALIIFLGMLSQWVAWRYRIPAILILLLVGILTGPVTGYINPDLIFKDLLIPFVSLGVALILFEGGMNLKLNELQKVGSTIRNLVTTGVVVSWILISLSALVILGLSLEISLVFGAVLVVTGPTVILPLLSHVRPKGKVGHTLKWEGIFIDPIGALLATVVFESIMSGGVQGALTVVIFSISKTVFISFLLSLSASSIILVLIRNSWIPDFLDNPLTFASVICAFTVSNLVQPESGLLTATLMGIIFANQTFVSVRHIIHFKEDLRLIIISTLFIVLAARLKLSDFNYIDYKCVVFLIVLILIIRPLSVAMCADRNSLSLKERIFLGMMAPRGIIAAAIASVFAIQLQTAGYVEASKIVPFTFFIIIGTVVFYGLISLPLARMLGITAPDPQGVIFVGAHWWARKIAAELKKQGIQVAMVDTNRKNIISAGREGIVSYCGNILDDKIGDEIDLSGIGNIFAMTSNEEANALALIKYKEVFGRKGLFRLPVDLKKSEIAGGRGEGKILFGPGIDYSGLEEMFSEGAEVITLNYGETSGFDDKHFIPLMALDEKVNMQILNSGGEIHSKDKSRIIGILKK
ncbi:MAG TPA: hypothetical protein DCZ94_09755 [Lentisphaeria bacterium]|nr:MAG: hypothetical protein A2X48_18995 [Lentisphaerae bacterium GWF2_49_21]HBC87227.1 hypothetical protein [Lentisphaeria bacterium]